MNYVFPVQQTSSYIPEWTGKGVRVGEDLVSVLEYSSNDAGWNDDLTTLHVEAVGANHPIGKASQLVSKNLYKILLPKLELHIL